MKTEEPQDARELLERFIVDNDDLRTLEETIGRFNIFDALNIARREVSHSYFLAWLLDPHGSHGQGALFLRSILMDLLKKARSQGFQVPLSPIELDGEDFRGVEIRREWRNIDLLIVCDAPKCVMVIENKIDSGEHSDQLNRYKDLIAREFPSFPTLNVFLTKDASEASDDSWVPYSYADIVEVLERVQRSNRGAIGEDVATFLSHYLRLIRGRFMDDKEISQLCQRIYRNHRQALELIYEHAGSPTAGVLGAIEDAIEQHSGKWQLINATSNKVFFIPKSWLTLLPPIGTRPKFDPRYWIVLRFEIRKKSGFFGASVWPTSDLALRLKIIKRLTDNPKEFNFRLLLKTTSDKWSQLGRESIGTWKEDAGPDEEKVLLAVEKQLNDLAERMEKVTEALTPIFSDGDKSQQV